MKAAFYKGTKKGSPGIYNRLIRFIDGGPYSHVELVFADGVSASASFMDGGVRFKQIDFDPSHWDFIEMGPWAEATARRWFVAHNKEKYDLMGNLRFVFGFVPESKTKWFCSEAVAASLGYGDPWRYGPNLLAEVLRS